MNKISFTTLRFAGKASEQRAEFTKQLEQRLPQAFKVIDQSMASGSHFNSDALAAVGVLRTYGDLLGNEPRRFSLLG